MKILEVYGMYMMMDKWIEKYKKSLFIKTNDRQLKGYNILKLMATLYL